MTLSYYNTVVLKVQVASRLGFGKPRDLKNMFAARFIWGPHDFEPRQLQEIQAFKLRLPKESASEGDGYFGNPNDCKTVPSTMVLQL